VGKTFLHDFIEEYLSFLGCDPSVVSNINYGKNYYDNTLEYPLRKS